MSGMVDCLFDAWDRFEAHEAAQRPVPAREVAGPIGPGARFGLLTVIREEPARRRGAVHWQCACDCGVQPVVSGSNLRRGKTRSCGCLRKAPRAKKPKEELTAEKARELLSYDPGTGVLTWRAPRSHNVKPGDTTGCPMGNYLGLAIGRRTYRAHRIAWLIYHGEWPSGQIDHVDGDFRNNRIANLRLADCSQNGANSRRPKNNTSGHKGVTWRKSLGKWQAHIGVRGKKLHLGFYDTSEEAAAAYRRAAREYFGQFARCE